VRKRKKKKKKKKKLNFRLEQTERTFPAGKTPFCWEKKGKELTGYSGDKARKRGWH